MSFVDLNSVKRLKLEYELISNLFTIWHFVDSCRTANILSDFCTCILLYELGMECKGTRDGCELFIWLHACALRNEIWQKQTLNDLMFSTHALQRKWPTMTLSSVQVNIIKVKVDKYAYSTSVRSDTSCEKYGKVCQRFDTGLHSCHVLS